MTPINPTPYIVVYAILIFVLPWLIFTTYLIKALFRSHQLNASIFTFGGYSYIKELIKTDTTLKILYTKLKKSLIIVLFMWLVGAFILVVTLYSLNSNNLLINSNNGIIG